MTPELPASLPPVPACLHLYHQDWPKSSLLELPHCHGVISRPPCPPSHCPTKPIWVIRLPAGSQLPPPPPPLPPFAPSCPGSFHPTPIGYWLRSCLILGHQLPRFHCNTLGWSSLSSLLAGQSARLTAQAANPAGTLLQQNSAKLNVTLLRVQPAA